MVLPTLRESDGLKTEGPKSRLIPVLSAMYCLVASVGLFIAVLGHLGMPAPLPTIDVDAARAESIEQAARILEQAQQQEPGNPILRTFYKGWLLEFDYPGLAEYTEPQFDDDSFELRVSNYNSTVAIIDEIYEDAVVTLTALSSGSLMLAMLMLWAPRYFVSLLLGTYPALVVFVCAFLGINSDPLGVYWAPFIILGATIFLLQLIFAIRFGRPEHRTEDARPLLMRYRRGLVLTNFGMLLFVGALLMTTGALSGEVRSVRAMFGLMVFGEGGIALLGYVMGILFTALGVREMNRKPPA